ncbi:hypothetical protein RJT34_02163 [Clitoria ternatea]|uniref:Uncharacterized protein n=1 Tax=Clitoria ternatea TaxID=43366 RepID=A0AAN9KJP9_CLITE
MESFSFPSTPNQESEFEFGSLTPSSPTTEPFTTSPADQLFLNGRLQPHSFPLLQHHHGTSRTSSKDSLLSSRSNSTNSSCSSARTSSSDCSETRLFHNKVVKTSTAAYVNVIINKPMVSSSHHQAYGCSQRWQYITPVPVLNRDGSIRRKRDVKQGKKKEEEGTKRNNNKKKNKGVKLRFGRRIFRWFVMACRECHAMEPSTTKANNNKGVRYWPRQHDLRNGALWCGTPLVVDFQTPVRTVFACCNGF